MLDELPAVAQAAPLPLDVLRAYMGTYGPLTIYLNKNKLFCKHTEAGGLQTELKYIANRRFVLDDNTHIELVKASKGNFTGIKLYVSDGNIVEERRKAHLNVLPCAYLAMLKHHYHEKNSHSAN
ncbi:hypothetical protein [Spirosoma jeollabukense]